MGDYLPDHELEFEILGYQAMSKNEHSIHTRAILALLLELRERRREALFTGGKLDG